MSRFPWRPMSSAPRDGTTIVALRVVVICGGEPRPSDLDLDLSRIHAVGETRWRHAVAGCSMHAERGHWLPVHEFEAALAALPPWTAAPLDRPVALLRPGQWLDARIAWGAALDARPLRGIGPTPDNPASGLACSTGWLSRVYIDGLNCADRAPMRWCEVADVVPAAETRARRGP